MKKKIVLNSIRKIVFLTLVTTFISLNSYTQQLPHYTQYLYNMQIINPAFVGYRAELSISVLARQQWVGVEGAPTTRTFSLNGRTRRGLGIGTTIVNDKIGLSQVNNINVDASYTIVTSQNSRLAFGLKGGLLFFNNNLFNGVTVDSEVYASTTGRFVNVGFGGLFYTKKFYVGLSVPQLLESPQFYIEDNLNQAVLSKNPNIFLSSGVLFKLSESLLFRPSTMVRYTVNQPTSIDVNASFLYNEILETGISYRYKNSVSGLFTVVLNKKYRVGYAYDHRFSVLGRNLSSHEIVFQMDLNFKRNTRWLLFDNCYF
ncbi:PorP/SprF family type IX secretion system membrane protein [Polaribacter sp.]|uniref:PorP/SprF family type IX secretion system membrane protein n=1 Tax=Polaribacter sp. TaxID=1920175 RepID=UPI003F6D0570